MAKIAVVQAGSVLFDTHATVKKLERFARDAAAEGAKLILFPEAFVGGYPKGVGFGAIVGSRSPDGRDLFRRYFEFRDHRAWPGGGRHRRGRGRARRRTS